MKIHHLSPVEAQKIAAGEVVERPANTLKELIENSLDAGATKIQIALQDGGKASLIITDNGCGMSPEDARICFLRHTTSKLHTVNEIESLDTFGFRGEALASICSVAHVTITTKEHHAPHATRLTITEEKVTKEEAVSFQNGTRIEITDLFCTVPARKKFLKQTSTELNHCTTLFKAFALNHTNIHFTFAHNGSVLYNCPAVNTLEERVTQLFDTQVHTNLQTLNFTHSDITLSGALTGAHYKRYDRNNIFFFVNNRWVKNFKLSHALMKGYLKLLPPGRYPFAIIQIHIPPHEVDINTHPKKEEVVFLHPRRVEQALTKAITQSLESLTSDRLYHTLQDPFLTTPSLHSFQKTETPWFAELPATSTQNSFKDALLLEKKYTNLDTTLVQKPAHTSPTTHQTTHEKSILNAPQQEDTLNNHQEKIHEPVYTLIGQYKNTYLLLDHPEGLLLIDQHAAHERILYEQFAQRFIQQETITLLFPEIISLAADDYALLKPHLQIFIDQGIHIEPFGTQQYAITATPVYAKNVNMYELVQETIGYLRETDTADQELFFKTVTEKMRAQMACKTAVKAGDELSLEKMTQLLNDLEKTANRFSCPHGRPTSWLLDITTIEKKFKRKL